MDGALIAGLPPRLDRRVNLQSYGRGHSQLGLVAPASWYLNGRTERADTTVEILFKDVVTIVLPEYFPALAVEVANADEIGELRRFLGQLEFGDRTVYRLRGAGDLRGYVVAGAIFWSERGVDM